MLQTLTEPLQTPKAQAKARDILVLATLHKPYPYESRSGWLRPCTVGNLKLDGEAVFSDAQGTNIASLNASFCELTTQYWAWKNLKDVEHIGFCHYRRYFYLHPVPTHVRTVKFDQPVQAMSLMASEVARQQALRLLRHADVIVPCAYFCTESIAAHYRRSHWPEHWELFREVLFDRHPEYGCFEPYLEDSNKEFLFNMAIWKWSHFDRYCRELFGVMFEVYARARKPEDAHQGRFIGFLAERFLSFYLYANALRTVEVPVVAME